MEYNNRKGRLRSARNQSSVTRRPAADSVLSSLDLSQPLTDKSTDLRGLPLTHELAFYVAVESCKDVKENWDAVVKSYAISTKNDQVIIMHNVEVVVAVAIFPSI